MNRKFGLGKGIDALIEDYNLTNKDINYIDINDIKNSPYQPRSLITRESIKELINSIEINGLIEPLVVRKKDSYYELIAGHRRLEALKILNKNEVPVYVINVSDEEAARFTLIENIEREDLNPFDLATTLSKIINIFNLTHNELSKNLGKSRVFVTNYLRLLSLDGKCIEALKNSQITESHGRLLLQIESISTRDKLLNKIIEDNLTVRELEKEIKKLKKTNTQKKQKEEIKEIYKQYEEKLKLFLNKPVKIKKKKIEIYYKSDKELSEVLNILNINTNITILKNLKE